MDALRSWITKYVRPSVEGGRTTLKVMAGDEELDELTQLLMAGHEKFGATLLNALQSVGINICTDCQEVVLPTEFKTSEKKCNSCS